MIDTTRLLRQAPFGEWVNVYYDPRKVTQRQLLGWIRANRCPRAALDHDPGKNALMNAFAAPGDVVQLRVEAAAATSLKSVELPEGWKLIGPEAGDEIEAGVRFFSVQVSGARRQRAGVVRVLLADGTEVKGEVAVVSQVGKH